MVRVRLRVRVWVRVTVDDRPQLDPVASVHIDGRRGHVGVAAPRPVEYCLHRAVIFHAHFRLRPQRGLEDHIVVSLSAARACGYDDDLAHAVGHACAPAL